MTNLEKMVEAIEKKATEAFRDFMQAGPLGRRYGRPEIWDKLSSLTAASEGTTSVVRSKPPELPDYTENLMRVIAKDLCGDDWEYEVLVFLVGDPVLVINRYIGGEREC